MNQQKPSIDRQTVGTTVAPNVDRDRDKKKMNYDSSRPFKMSIGQ